MLGSGDVEAVAARVAELLDLPLHRRLTANEVARGTRLLTMAAALRRPDLVPRSGPGWLVAVEGEATVNRARPLQTNCAGWTRGRRVVVVRYHATRAAAARAAHAHDVMLTQTLEARGVSFAA